jgi:hypothetical protein
MTLASIWLVGCPPPPSSHELSGTVRGAVTEGVTVTLSEASSATATTDATGAYRFGGLANGSYTVAASLGGYTFTPASRAVTVNGAGVAGQDFTASVIAPTFRISGSMSGSVTAGVTVALSGMNSATATTDANGAYSFGGLANGGYTVAASLGGYTFTPASRAVTVSGANVTGQDFTSSATVPTFRISGAVSGVVASGVIVRLSGASSVAVATDPTGAYSFDGLVNGTFTVTPSLAGYTFAPPSRSVTLDGTNVTGQDFLATSAGS